MRRTFGYLAKVIVNRYRDETEAKEHFWKLCRDGEGNKALYQELGDGHARSAYMLLEIIMDEELATTEEIAQINADCIKAVIGKGE